MGETHGKPAPITPQPRRGWIEPHKKIRSFQSNISHLIVISFTNPLALANGNEYRTDDNMVFGFTSGFLFIIRNIPEGDKYE